MNRIKIAAMLFCLSVTCAAFGQISEGEAKSKGAAFASAAEMQFEADQARGVLKSLGNSKVWAVFSPPAVYIVDAETGKIRSYDNSEWEMGASRDPKDGDKCFKSEEDAWTKGEDILQAIGARKLDRGEIIGSFSPKGTPGIQDGMVVLKFYDKPFGYETHGNGNHAILSLSERDGRLIHGSFVDRWTYDAPNVKLDQTTAVQKAAESLGGPMSDPRVLIYYASGNAQFGSLRGDELTKAKRCRLCYVVSSSKAVILIDAETGECMGGSMRAGPKQNGSETPTSAVLKSPSRGTKLPGELLGGAVFVLSIGLVVMLSRRKFGRR